MLKRWKKISSQLKEDNTFWKYSSDIFELPSGERQEYFYGEINDGALVVPVLDDGRLVLVMQYRYLRDKQSVGFPKGRLLSGESAQVGAEREMREEIGFTSSNFVKTGSFDSLDSHFKETMHIFVADELSQVPKPPAETTEDVEVIIRRVEEFEEMIRRGEIWDGHTLAAWTLSREQVLKKIYERQQQQS